MSEFLASVVAKAAVMLLEALITRIVQSLISSMVTPAGLRLA